MALHVADVDDDIRHPAALRANPRAVDHRDRWIAHGYDAAPLRTSWFTPTPSPFVFVTEERLRQHSFVTVASMLACSSNTLYVVPKAADEKRLIELRSPCERVSHCQPTERPISGGG